MHAPHSSHTRILAFDDDSVLLQRMQQSLADGGYAALTSTEWDRAPEVIAQMQPALVIIDPSPGHESRGWKTLDVLKHVEEVQRIPAIVYSGAAHELDRDARVLEQFGVRVLPRPVDLEDLPRQVGEVLAAH